jgi:2-polyprenyl-3-methyl-5-hydroxy-6-metoxy-1,4-benzoquinol methylase
MTWDREFASGAWDYLDESPAERARHAVIAMLCRSFAEHGAILDVGCGEGTLLDFLTPSQKRHYLGIDISKEAVAIARRKRRRRVVDVDATSFTTRALFDVIIFNEVLYYLDAEAILAMYGGFLNPSGHILLSTYRTRDADLGAPILEHAREAYCSRFAIEIAATTKGLPVTWHIEVFDARRHGSA